MDELDSIEYLKRKSERFLLKMYYVALSNKGVPLSEGIMVEVNDVLAELEWKEQDFDEIFNYLHAKNYIKSAVLDASSCYITTLGISYVESMTAEAKRQALALKNERLTDQEAISPQQTTSLERA